MCEKKTLKIYMALIIEINSNIEVKHVEVVEHFKFL